MRRRSSPPGAARAATFLRWGLAPFLVVAASQAQPARLELRDLAGAPVSLAAHHDRIVVLNFWATWCVPCRREMPLLQQAHAAYSSRGVDVIGASTDAVEDRAKVEADARRLGLGFPVWVGATTDHMGQLGLGSELPATAIVDRDGTIVARIRGVVEERDLRKRIDWLLSDRLSPKPWRDDAPRVAAAPRSASLVPS